MSIVFDVIFLIQHYLIYPVHKRPKPDELNLSGKTENLDSREERINLTGNEKTRAAYYEE